MPMKGAPEPWTCPTEDCSLPVERLISGGRVAVWVEDYENVGKERGSDCAGEFIGLPDKKISLGKDSRGHEHFRFEPTTVADVHNRREFLEAAKRVGLSPGDSGRRRSVGQR